jgi:transcriptional regulator with XRE-family HTH domain
MDVSRSYFDPRLYSSDEICGVVGSRAKALRLTRQLRRSDVARAVGVSVATIGRFERTGKVGFDIFVGIALALGADRELADLFPRPFRSTDQLIANKAGRSTF